MAELELFFAFLLMGGRAAQVIPKALLLEPGATAFASPSSRALAARLLLLLLLLRLPLLLLLLMGGAPSVFPASAAPKKLVIGRTGGEARVTRVVQSAPS